MSKDGSDLFGFYFLFLVLYIKFNCKIIRYGKIGFFRICVDFFCD